MKTTILTILVFLATCFVAEAQSDIAEVQEVTYYGVDFSKVKIFRGKETPEEFQKAFKAINDLTLHEDKKYNFEKFFKKDLNTASFETVDARNAAHQPEMLPRKMSSKQLAEVRLTPEDVKEVISSYGKGTAGVGVVIIAVLLNKDKPEAKYEVVFFDQMTQNVIFEKEVVGKAGGAGLRNFWANSVYDAVKGWKYKLK